MGIEEFLRKKFHIEEVVPNNWNFDCPFCDDTKKRCGMHQESGFWNCFNCQKKGKGLKSFQKALDGEVRDDLEIKDSDRVTKDRKENEKEHVNIKQDLAARHLAKIDAGGRGVLEYLTKKRGFKRETIEHFQLGSWKTNGFEYVSIPFWKRGKLVNIKYRAIDYKDRKWKWRRIRGGESSLFHDDVVEHENDTIFLTEAELDGVALWNAGFKNVVAVTTGAKSFKQEWFERLAKFKKIFIVYDNDVDGQDGAKKVATRLGLDRCFNILLPKIEGLPKVDVNDYFWDQATGKPRHTRLDFQKLVKSARRYEVTDVISLRDAIKDAYKFRFLADEDEVMGFPTPWPKVNKLTNKGTRPGHLVVVSGVSKVGKTTWVQNWLRYTGIQDVPVFIYECEMKPDQLSEKWVAMETLDMDQKEDFSEEDFSWATYKLPVDKIWIGHPRSEMLTLENVCNTIRAAVQRYGIRVVVFDNLHFLVRSDNVKDEIGRVTRTFKLLAESLNVMFLLIVHPRKVGNKEPTPDDLKDSSSIFQDLDTLIFVHRRSAVANDKDDDDTSQKSGYTPLTKVTVTGRWSPGGVAWQYFDGPRGLFYDRGERLEKEMGKYRAQQTKGKKNDKPTSSNRR